MAPINFFLCYTDYRANFHAVVDTLSDVKQPANTGQSRVSAYFDGYVIDGTARIRFVCFNPQKHETIASLAQNGKALAFGNVLMKKNRVTMEMEAHLQDNTSFMRSPKKMNLPNHPSRQYKRPEKDLHCRRRQRGSRPTHHHRRQSPRTFCTDNLDLRLSRWFEN